MYVHLPPAGWLSHRHLSSCKIKLCLFILPSQIKQDEQTPPPPLGFPIAGNEATLRSL